MTVLDEMAKQISLNSVTQYGENALHLAFLGNADPTIISELVHRGGDILEKSDKSIGE